MDTPSDNPSPDGTNRQVQERVLRASVWGLVAALVSSPLNLVAVAVLSRQLGASGFGAYASYAFVLPLVIAVTDLGLTNSFGYRGALAYGRGDHDELRRTTREALSWSLLRAPLVLAVGALVLKNSLAFTLFSLSIVFSTAASGAMLAIQSAVRAAEINRVALIGTIAGMGASVAAALSSAAPAVVFAAGAAAQNMPTLLLLLKVDAAGGLRAASLRPARLCRLAEDARFGLTTFLSAQLLTLLASRSELLFFTKSQTTARGVYAAAFSAGNRITIPLDALQGPLGIALTVVSGDSDTLRRGLRRALRLDGALFALSVAPAVVASAVLSTLIFPASFAGVTAATIGLAATSILASAMHPIQSYYFAERALRHTFWAAVIGVTANLGLSALLVPLYGLAGAVAANSLGCVIYAAALLRPLWGSDMSRDARRYVWQITTATVAVVAWASALLAGQQSVWRIAAAATLACLQTLVLARVCPYLSRADVSFVVSALPRRVARGGRTALGFLRLRPDVA